MLTKKQLEEISKASNGKQIYQIIGSRPITADELAQLPEEKRTLYNQAVDNREIYSGHSMMEEYNWH